MVRCTSGTCSIKHLKIALFSGTVK